MAQILRTIVIICSVLFVISSAVAAFLVWHGVHHFWYESGIIVAVVLGIAAMVCCILRFYCGDLSKSEPTSAEATTGSSSDPAARQLQAPQEPSRPDQDQPAGPSRRDEIILDELNKALNLGLKKRPESRVEEAAV